MNDLNKDNDFRKITLVITAVIIGFWLINWFLLKDCSETYRGTFGDMFGAINALFSGLALAGIIITILLQRKELQLQREELSETREEFKIQNETLKIQRFENTFFNLLDLHHQIVAGMDFSYYKNKESNKYWVGRKDFINEESGERFTINGRDIFRFNYNKMADSIKKNPENFNKIYFDCYKIIQTDLGHYFRNLYRMIKLVDEADFFYDKSKISALEEFKIKYKYTSIIRSQISDYELLWLFYNCLSENGKEKFKPLIEKYAFLKNLPKNLLPISEHRYLYESSAFFISI